MQCYNLSTLLTAPLCDWPTNIVMFPLRIGQSQINCKLAYSLLALTRADGNLFTVPDTQLKFNNGYFQWIKITGFCHITININSICQYQLMHLVQFCHQKDLILKKKEILHDPLINKFLHIIYSSHESHSSPNQYIISHTAFVTAPQTPFEHPNSAMDKQQVNTFL